MDELIKKIKEIERIIAEIEKNNLERAICVCCYLKKERDYERF